MKKLLTIIPLTVLLCFTLACQNKAEKAELEKFRTQAKVEEQNKEIVNHMWEAWNKRDFEAIKELVAPEYHYYSPSNRANPKSREETIEEMKMFFTGVPDANFTVEELIISGNKIISRWVVKGTHQGQFEGIPATGNKIEYSGIMITRIENEKIIEDRENWDGLGLFEQLGMELRPKKE